jgi:hypothetical protein
MNEHQRDREVKNENTRVRDRRMESMESRRDFVKTLFRGACFCALGLAAGFLLRRGRISFKASQVCVSRGICRGCPVFRGCGLPQALSAKETFKRRSRG